MILPTREVLIQEVELHNKKFTLPPQFKDAVRVAHRSTLKKFKTGAALYDANGELISVGWSHVPNFTLQTTRWSEHAEHHLLKRTYPPDIVNATLVIVTISRRGNFTSALPCPSCLNQILKHDIKKVIVSAPYCH